MMLSESQERMLMVLKPREGSRGRGHLPQMGPRLRHRRHTTDDLRFRVKHQGEVKSPTCRSRTSATRRRNMTARGRAEEAGAARRRRCAPQMDVADALLKLIGSPDAVVAPLGLGAVRHLIQGNSLQIPGGDAGVVRVEGHPPRRSPSPPT
jgi:phosphoribosylformylglycinamidine (FGAM) synthase-like enzyme